MPLRSSFSHPALAGLRTFPWEAVLWAAALGVLAGTDPAAPPLLELCLFKTMGLPGCPGCGLGHAIAHTLDGNLAAALHAHPLGPAAAGVLGARIAALAHGYSPFPSPLSA